MEFGTLKIWDSQEEYERAKLEFSQPPFRIKVFQFYTHFRGQAPKTAGVHYSRE
jgi:hypothetical protein